MLNKQKKWYEKAGEHSDVIISTRVRLARNLVDYPFPNRMTTEQKAEVEKKVSDAILNSNSAIASVFGFMPMDELTREQAVSLVERHIVSPEFVANAKEVFNSNKIIAYGDGVIKKVASFCGGGSDHALKAVCGGATDADTIVSSDIPHHVLKELVEKGKKVVIIPHYVSEQYGFEKFYAFAKNVLNEKAGVYYFLDKRFM